MSRGGYRMIAHDWVRVVFLFLSPYARNFQIENTLWSVGKTTTCPYRFSVEGDCG